MSAFGRHLPEDGAAVQDGWLDGAQATPDAGAAALLHDAVCGGAPGAIEAIGAREPTAPPVARANDPGPALLEDLIARSASRMLQLVEELTGRTIG